LPQTILQPSHCQRMLRPRALSTIKARRGSKAGLRSGVVELVLSLARQRSPFATNGNCHGFQHGASVLQW
jgi:hypothetical protein